MKVDAVLGMLANKTLFVTGASRGIGLAIALKAARDGANVVIAAKTSDPHPKLPGTIYTAAKEIEAAGGKCLPCIVDVREENTIISAVENAVKQFGGIDILVNNASAINLSSTLDLDMKRYDLMHTINTRGTFLTSKICIPFLKKSKNPHILNLSPPLSLNPRWFSDNLAYTMAKYGMSMCVLGMAEEFKSNGIAVNALWPRTAIATAAIEFIAGKDVTKQCRKAEIVADAAYEIITKDSRSLTGKFLIDEDVLKEAGITDFDQYAISPGNPLMVDFFLDDYPTGAIPLKIKEAEYSSPGQASKLFDKIKNILSDDMVKSIGATYSFELKGNDAGKWYLDMKSGSGAVGQGEPPSGAADVTLILDSSDFVKMFSGNLKPTSAFMSGKLKIKGDMGMAMKLEKIMATMRSKL